MTGRIRRCPRDRAYTLAQTCGICKDPTITAHPARFSPQDPYGSYRRIARAWKR